MANFKRINRKQLDELLKLFKIEHIKDFNMCTFQQKVEELNILKKVLMENKDFEECFNELKSYGYDFIIFGESANVRFYEDKFRYEIFNYTENGKNLVGFGVDYNIYEDDESYETLYKFRNINLEKIKEILKHIFSKKEDIKRFYERCKELNN